MRQFIIFLLLLPIIGLAQTTSKTVTVDVNEDDGKRKIKVVSKVNGENKVYEWTDEGEIPEDIKKQLKEADINISSLEGGDGEHINVIVTDGDEDVIVDKQKIVIKKIGDGDEVMELIWDGEGEMSEEMKDMLHEHDISIEELKGHGKMKTRMKMHKDKSKKARYYAKEKGRRISKEHHDDLNSHENVFVFDVDDDELELSDAYMGVHIQSTDDGGAKVIEILKDGPADKAGIERGDVVKKVNGARTRDMEALLNLLNYYEPEDQVELTVVRDGSERIVKLTLGQRPESFR